MTFQGIKKGVGAFVVSLSTVLLFSSLKAAGIEAIGTSVYGERLQQACAVQKTLPSTVLSIKA